MIMLAYELRISVFILPMGVHYRDRMIVERGTLPVNYENDLPSVFNA